MLIVSRDVSDDRDRSDLLIGEDVIVRVLDVRGSQVDIGVIAPKDVPVDRPAYRRARQLNDNSEDYNNVY